MDAELGALLDRERIAAVILASAELLDGGRYEAWLALFAEGAEYELVADSVEVGRRVVWWHAPRDELGRMLAQLPEHVNDPATRVHLVTPIRTTVTGDRAEALSNFAIYRTTAQGVSHLYVVGRYEDRFVRVDGDWRFTRHVAMVETRMLEPAMHVPV